MPVWADILVGLAAALALVYAALLVALWRTKPPGNVLVAALRLLPDVARLVKRLATDRRLPLGLRLRLWFLLAYLGSPLDLVPDFVPVLGYADDALLVALVLRAVVRRAGDDALRRHWPGTEAGLAAIRRLAGLGR